MNDHECKILFIILLLKWDFIAFKMNIISMRKRVVNTDVVNEVICTRQNVFKCVVIRVLMTRPCPLNISDIIPSYKKDLDLGIVSEWRPRTDSRLTQG